MVIDSDFDVLEQVDQAWADRGITLERRNIYTDIYMEDLSHELMKDMESFDSVSCLQEHLDMHLFESTSSLVNSLRHIYNLLKPGGYFFGMIFDGSEIWNKCLKAVNGVVTTQGGLATVNMYPDELKKPDYSREFTNVKYEIKIDTPSPLTCYLPHFPTLIAEARKLGLEMIEITNCNEFLEDHKLSHPDLMPDIGTAKNAMAGPQREVLALYCIFVFKKTS